MINQSPGGNFEYDLVRSDDADFLKKLVNNRIRSGWTPLGSPFVQKDKIFQAMTRN